MADYLNQKVEVINQIYFFLVDEFYKLRDLEAYKVNSIHHEIWLVFTKKWKNCVNEKNKLDYELKL
jgi:hypothetical protein